MNTLLSFLHFYKILYFVFLSAYSVKIDDFISL